MRLTVVGASLEDTPQGRERRDHTPGGNFVD